MERIISLLQGVFVCLLGVVYGEIVFRITSTLAIKFIYTPKFLYMLLMMLFAIPAISAFLIRTIALKWLIFFYFSSILYLWYRITTVFGLYYGG
jgi:hypothetical protein